MLFVPIKLLFTNSEPYKYCTYCFDMQSNIGHMDGHIIRELWSLGSQIKASETLTGSTLVV